MVYFKHEFEIFQAQDSPWGQGQVDTKLETKRYIPKVKFFSRKGMSTLTGLQNVVCCM